MISIKIQMQKIAAVIILSVTMLFGSNAFSYGASYYVDNTANGANNGSSWPDAWESFADIDWESVSPGDTIYISGGSTSKIYHNTLTVRKSGTSGNPITFTVGTDAEHNGKVIIDGDNTRVFVRVNGYDYIQMSHITGIECGSTGGSGCVNIDSTSYSRFEYFIIEDYDGTHGAFNIKNSDYCTIGHNTISTVTYTHTQVDGIYAQDNSNNIYEYNNITVQNNYSPTHDDGLQVYKSSNLTVRNNRITIQCPSATDNKQGIYLEECNGTNHIYDNVVIRTAGDSAWGSAIAFQNKNGGSGTVHISNNTIKLNSNETHGIYINSPSVNNWTVKNNTIWKTVGSWVCMSLYTANESYSNIDFNLLYNEGGSNVVFYKGKSYTWSEWRGLGFDENGLNSRPSLNPDLSPDSSGKGTGCFCSVLLTRQINTRNIIHSVLYPSA